MSSVAVPASRSRDAIARPAWMSTPSCGVPRQIVSSSFPFQRAFVSGGRAYGSKPPRRRARSSPPRRGRGSPGMPRLRSCRRRRSGTGSRPPRRIVVVWPRVRRRSVERAREPAAVGGRERVVLAEVVEDRDRELAQTLALGRSRIGHSVEDELERSLGLVASSAASTSGCSPVARSSSSTPSIFGGASSWSRNDETTAGDWAPANSATTRPSRNPFTAGIPCTRYVAAKLWFASTSTFANATAPSLLSISRSRTGASAWHGPHQSAQKSTTTGSSCERSRTSCSNVSSVTSIASAMASGCQRRRRRRSRPRARRARRPRRHPRASVCEVDLDLRPGVEAEGARTCSSRSVQLLRREDPAPAGLAPRDALELAELLERVDAHVRVRADAERDRARTGSARPEGSRRRGRLRSSGRRRRSCRLRRGGRARLRRRASRGRPSSARRGSRCGRGARSGGSRARRGTPRSPAAARRRGHAAGAPRVRRRRRSPGASRRGMRGRSGGRRRRGARPRAAPRPPRGTPRPTPGGSGGDRRARRRRGGARARLRPRPPPQPPRTPRRPRGSGTRRRRCTRRRASRGTSPRTTRGRARASAARPPRASSRARPRSRHPPPARGAPAGTCGCARSRSPEGERAGHGGRR